MTQAAYPRATVPAAAGSPIVEVKGVSKRFGRGPEILSGVSFQASPGDFVSLIGPSGCGKSTLLRMLAGLTPASGGSIRVDGTTPEDARAHAFFVFQDANLLPWRRVAANVELPLMLRGDPKPSRRARVAVCST